MSDTDLENMIARKLTEAAAIGGVFHPNSSLVTEVIQATKDAGYIRIQPTLDELQQKTLEEYPNKLMTGQEWYNRFWSIYNEDRLPAAADATIIRQQVDAVAKRAAGLADQ